MSKVLITGSLGLTGKEAVKFFKEKGWEVVGIDNNQRSKLFDLSEEKYEESINIDIRDEKLVDALFNKHNFDAIIHTAAQPSHDYSKDHVLEDFDINARGTLILLEATRKYCPDAVFVHCSTDKVYGENMKGNFKQGGYVNFLNGEKKWLLEKSTRYHSEYPFDENLSLDNTTRSPFGCSKTASDIYVQEYGRYFGMKTVCFRLGCITGKNHKGAELHGFLAYLARCIKEGRTYNIFGYKGKQVRDQIHAYDLVNAMWHFIQNPKVGAVYNMGGGPERSVSIIEAINLIQKELDLGKIDPDTGFWRETFKYIDKPRKGDRIWDIHDVSKFKKDYPKWDYKYSLQDIIKDLCNG